MSESNEPSPAATREPQQQSPSTSTSAASEPQPSSTAASAASDPPRHQSHGESINLTGDGLGSEPARAVAGGIDTAGIDKGLWQPNKRDVAFYWRFFWNSITDSKKALCLLCQKVVIGSSPSNLQHHLNQHHLNQHHAKHPAYTKAKAHYPADL